MKDGMKMFGKIFCAWAAREVVDLLLLVWMYWCPIRVCFCGCINFSFRSFVQCPLFSLLLLLFLYFFYMVVE